MKQALYGFTDYPFTELGDVAYAYAPLRSVKAIGFDGDKYITAIVAGRQVSFKYAYFFKNYKDAIVSRDAVLGMDRKTYLSVKTGKFSYRECMELPRM